MKKTDYIILAVLQLCVILFIARYQTIPGNIDADYYFMGGVRLAQGYGFTENFIWNYFDDPASVSLPQPSHAYWMPLASILAALGMWLAGDQSFASGRLAFILIAVFIPPLTAALSYRITSRRDLAVLSGLCAICSGFYLPFLPVTENYGVFMVLGALYFLNMGRLAQCHSERSEESLPLSQRPFVARRATQDDMSKARKVAYLILGILSGLMSLARSDGMLWLFLTILLILASLRPNLKPASVFFNLFLALSGFLIVMLPWYLRNLEVFGAPMSIAARRAFWLTEYYQTFMYPADRLTYSNWLASGWDSILAARLFALQRIISNVVTVQGAIILLPFVLFGAWRLRADARVRLGMIAWALLIIVFTVIFPFASVRGSFIHAVCTLQPLLWSLAAVGFDALLQALSKWRTFQLTGINLIFKAAFVLMLAFISYASLNALIFSGDGWQRGELTYPKVEAFLIQQGIQSDEPIMVTNPPGYTMMTDRPALMFPYGGEESVLEIAKRFNARYIVLKNDSINLNAHFNALYNDPDLYPSIQFVDQVDDVRIFKVATLP